MMTCPSCQRTYASNVEPLHCACGWHGEIPVRENPWDVLHRYAYEVVVWNPLLAADFITRWQLTIPNIDCDCQSKWERLNWTFDYTTRRGFFESTVGAHNEVSRRLSAEGKPHPTLTLSEAYAIWGPLPL